MTVSSETNSVTYAGNGVTTVFPYTFRILDQAEILVQDKDDTTGVITTKTIGSDYTVSNVGVNSGGNITMAVAPAASHTLILLRDMFFTQQDDYNEYDAFPAETLEEEIDRLTMMSQQLKNVTDRSLQLDPAVTGISTTLPSPSANKLLAWNTAATALENVSATAALSAYSIVGTTGIAAFTSSSVITLRSITGTANQITVTNGDGVSGAPTISIPTSAIFTTPKIGQINDSNNLAMLVFTTTASAVNQFTISNSITANGPVLAASGTDSNIDINLAPKGTGSTVIRGQAAVGGIIKFAEGTNNGTNTVGLRAPATIASDFILNLPIADGTSKQALITDGAGQLSFASNIATVKTQVLTGTGTYTPSTGMQFAIVELVGGGGAGGGTASTTGAQAAAAAGGVGGGYIKFLITAAQAALASMSYTVGGGGAAPSAGANAGNAGTATTLSVNSSNWGGAGGNGGGGSGAAVPPLAVQSGGSIANTVGATGTVMANILGGAPGPGLALSLAYSLGGQGGASGMGGVGGAMAGNAVGNAGSQLGSGGSGSAAAASQAAKAGGAGAAGTIIITEFCNQ